MSGSESKAPGSAGGYLLVSAFVGHANAQDDAVERAKLVEIFAFANLGAQPCANALDDASWNADVLKLMFGLKPPLTDAEITLKKKEVLEYRSRLGEAQWCELYAVKMHEGHLIFTATTNH